MLQDAPTVAIEARERWYWHHRDQRLEKARRGDFWKIELFDHFCCKMSCLHCCTPSMAALQYNNKVGHNYWFISIWRLKDPSMPPNPCLRKVQCGYVGCGKEVIQKNLKKHTRSKHNYTTRSVPLKIDTFGVGGSWKAASSLRGKLELLFWPVWCLFWPLGIRCCNSRQS